MSFNFYQETDHPWVKVVKFQNLTIEQMLRFETHSSGNNKPIAWVLDLDSTLFCTGPRTHAILKEYVNSQPANETWSWLAENFQPHFHRYSIRHSIQDTLNRLDPHRAEQWSYELWHELEPFWYGRFFSNNYLIHDVAYDGAAEFTHNIRRRGHNIIYLTGRDSPRMEIGTRTAITREGLAWDGHCQLMMKPDLQIPDLEYKTSASQDLRSFVHPIAFLENEPENLTMFAEQFPMAHIVWFHSVMSPKVPTKNIDQLMGQRSLWRLSGYV